MCFQEINEKMANVSGETGLICARRRNERTVPGNSLDGHQQLDLTAMHSPGEYNRNLKNGIQEREKLSEDERRRQGFITYSAHR
jgi:hypothetical protein